MIDDDVAIERVIDRIATVVLAGADRFTLRDEHGLRVLRELEDQVHVVRSRIPRMQSEDVVVIVAQVPFGDAVQLVPVEIDEAQKREE